MNLIIYFAESLKVPDVDIKPKEKWSTKPQNSCLSCDTYVSMMHRHHCRICGQGHFCDTCAPKRVYPNNFRICENCYESIGDSFGRSYLNNYIRLNNETILLIVNISSKNDKTQKLINTSSI